MIDQKSILIGTVLAVVLVLALGMIIPLIGGVIALVLAGILVGYLANNNFKVGAVNGAIMGLFTGIVYILVIYAVSGFSEKIIGGLIIFSLGSIPVYILLGLGGGIIGAVIKARQSNGQSEEDADEEIEVDQNEE